MKRIVALLSCLCCFVYISSGCFVLAEQGTVYAVVNNPNAADRLNLRISPDEKAESLGRYFNGVEVHIIEDFGNGWVKVEIGNGGTLKGYMMRKYLSFGENAVASAMPTFLSLSSAWELYHSPDEKETYTMHGYGETVTLLGFTSDWWHVQIGEKTGFVSSKGTWTQLTGNYYDGYTVASVNNPNPDDRLNLRKSASKESDSVGKYYNGCIVVVLDTDKTGWCRVRIGDLEGYMDSEFLDFDATISEATSAMPVVTVENPNGQGVNLRDAATTEAKAQALYLNGTRVQVLGITEDWCHVQVDGAIGFMMTKYLVPQLSYGSTSAGSSEIINSSNAQDNAWNGPTGYYTTADWTIPINEYTAIVNNLNPADRLHLRTKASSDSKSLGKYYNGVHVIINSNISDEWTEVSIGNLTGYMKMEYLCISGTGDAPKSAMPVMMVYNPNSAGNLHLREKQSMESKSLGLYSNGTKVTLMGFNDEWAHVIVDGKMGFMLAKYLQ